MGVLVTLLLWGIFIKIFYMNVVQLQKSLDQLEYDFRTIPDTEKNFIELQDRLEVLLKLISDLSHEEREPLLPSLQSFQTFLKEHLDNVQRQGHVLQGELLEKRTHKQAARAYATTGGKR